MRLKVSRTVTVLFLILLVIGCKNRDINEGEQFKPREINEDYSKFHFNRITYDGVEYLITERDNNNPHEGFGFMALSGNLMYQKQDSILAYLKTMAEIQKRIYAKSYNLSIEEVDSEYDNLLKQNYDQIKPE
jgi:hypothetical protein